MSEQQMESEGANSERLYGSYTGYEGQPLHHNGASFGQKLSLSSPGQASANMRLALAIVSLVLWLVLFLIVIIGSYFGISGSFSSNAGNLIEPLLILGLFIFTVLVFVLNILFNRK